MRDFQSDAEVDVFFVHPTTYIVKRGHKAWNAGLTDHDLNIRTDRGTIRNQATVFNGSCKVYAPRYRQAHLECFYTRRKEDALKALNLAYQDVRAAFEYYLEHYNKGRPLIIASHSQGTRHAAQLIRDFYHSDRAMPPLVVAYLVGMPVEKDMFSSLDPCQSADEVHCFCAWRTVHEKYKPNKFYPVGEEFVATNPLSWCDTIELAKRDSHQGAVLRKFYDGLYTEFVDVWSDNGLLRVSKPRIPGVPVMPMRNYHIADYNFFYANIRQNVKDRITAYFAGLETGG
jgi:hypothetical protein